MDDDESQNESGSEHSLPTFGPRIFGFMMNKHRCDDCGNYVDEDKMSYRIDYTREYPDPSIFMSSAHKIWTCNECHSLTRVLDDTSSSTNPVKGPNDEAASSSRTNQAVDNKVVQQKTTSGSCNEVVQQKTTNDQAVSSSRTNQAMDNEIVQKKTTSDESCNEISATNPPSQTHPRPAVEEASPPMKKQKQSDNDAHSDSESAK